MNAGIQLNLVRILLLTVWFIKTFSLLEGIPTHYGEAEPWKVQANKFGRTKPTRAGKPEDQKRKKNDGRPPDTIKDLLLKPKQKKVPLGLPSSRLEKKKVSFLAAISTADPKIIQAPNYPWNKNSCWLDTSLQLLYIAVQKVPREFSHISEALPKNSTLRTVLATLLERHTLDPQGENISAILRGQRDDIRKLLKQKKAIKSVTQFESLFVCTTLPQLTGHLHPEIDMVCRIDPPSRYKIILSPNICI
jgi:hypothetical protein